MMCLHQSFNLIGIRLDLILIGIFNEFFIIFLYWLPLLARKKG
ncbi:hypothetical protein swp_1758 [Shewanella piezotolerans WP3]|uniref:Uncharacterized protein n=1 Tax=Shewanella piezotolerans (strain WP3 / JCM 13877) TaxID=225849 RepID=B8CN24_SHEPW|nr:hypothetical protein swp_1758 [Shewanella piezotolerans WP3]